MKTIKIVIIANGLPPPEALCREVLTGSEFLIAADGGSKTALRYRLKPDCVIGDLDSLSPKDLAALQALKVPIFAYPADKDSSDLELALDFALERKPASLIILGAGGKRPDQWFANIMLLLKAHHRKVKAKLVEPGWEIFILPKRCKLSGVPGARLSLLPLTEQVVGVTLEGLKYPLSQAVLTWGHSKGLSNEFVECNAKVSYRGGILLAILERRARRKLRL